MNFKRERRLQKKIKELSEEKEKLRIENTRLREENKALKQKVKELEEKLEKLKNIKQPPYPAKPSISGKKKKPGRRPGFSGTSRRIPNYFDEEIDLTLTTCPHCGSELEREVEVRERFVEDIVPPRPHIKKYIIHRYYCTECRKNVSPRLIDVIPKCRFGIHLMLFVNYQRFVLHLPFNKIRKNLEKSFGIKTTDTTLYNTVRHVSNYYKEQFEEIKRHVRESEGVYTDETGWRIDGINRWLWTFATDRAVLFKIDRRRSSEVPKEVLGDEFDGVVVSDFYSAYNKLSYRKQKCFLHLLRETKSLSENGSREMKQFHRRVRKLVRDASKFKKNNPSRDEIKKARTRFEKRIDRIIQKNYSDHDCVRLAKRIRKHKDDLLTFLEADSVEYHNNKAERALRSSVVMRKITGGNRSRNGANIHEIMMSVIESCKYRSEDFLEEGVKFMRNQLK